MYNTFVQIMSAFPPAKPPTTCCPTTAPNQQQPWNAPCPMPVLPPWLLHGWYIDESKHHTYRVRAPLTASCCRWHFLPGSSWGLMGHHWGSKSQHLYPLFRKQYSAGYMNCGTSCTKSMADRILYVLNKRDCLICKVAVSFTHPDAYKRLNSYPLWQVCLMGIDRRQRVLLKKTS